MANQQILILFNLPVEATDSAPMAWAASDQGVLNEVEAVTGALETLGRPCRRAGVRSLREIPPALAAAEGSIVFNLVERLDGGLTQFNYVPALCEALGHPCTGGTSDSFSLTLDKWLTKARLIACGVRAPAGEVIPPGDAAQSRPAPARPVIVKPLCSDGSEGIDAGSLVRDTSAAALEAAVRRVHAQCGQPALIEQYIEGREFNLSLFEHDGSVEILPLAEIDFSLFPQGRPHIVDYAVKWIPGTIPGHISPRKVPAEVDDRTAGRIRELALGAWHACECRDYVRVDLRLDAEGRPYVLEVNANPDLSPRAGFPAALTAAGIPFAEFVRQILLNAESRKPAL